MIRKKQIFIPIGILAVGILSFVGFGSMKKPPEEKEEVNNTPIVATKDVELVPVSLDVKSYGVVQPKFETVLVAQVSGELVELSSRFVQGGFVKQGELLARIDPSDYRAALMDAEANLAAAKADLKQEIAQGKVAEEEWSRITDGSPTELSLRKPQLAKEIANVEAAEARLLIAQRNLERTEIIAPYDAMVDSRQLGLGTFIQKGSTVGKILSTDIAEVRLPVAENQLQYLIDHGEQAQVKLIGNFGGRQNTWEALIVRSEGVIDSKSRMNYLVAEVHDPYGLESENTPLRFGAYVNASISGQQVTQAAIVPRYLLTEKGVAVLDEELKLRYMPVEVMRHQGRDVVINQGLNPGDKLIVSALDYPIEGMQLATPELEVEAPLETEENPETVIASHKE